MKDKKKKNKMINRIKFLVVVAIIAAFVWFLIVSPMITFRSNEQKLETAAKRYFELNQEKLPTGERIKTLSLQDLYHDAYLDKDITAPYTNKVCSITDSWVKVRRENSEYKYYVYLDCGVLKSNIDHDGPEIKLNGGKEVTVGVGDKYEELGVKSVIDAADGKLKTKDVTIKGSVDTSEIGTYDLQYIAFDKLGNRTSVTRTVNVVKMLKNVVKKDLNGTSNYTGEPDNNFLRLSNMNFRIVGLDDKDNVVIVADEDIANVNYTKLDEWLKYYYKNLNKTTKKMIVKNKYCNMSVDESVLDSTQCNSYTKERNVYIPSIVDVNKAQALDSNFMKPYTMSWVANSKNNKEAYITRNIFYGDEYGKSFLAYDNTFNYGVRPMMTIKGDSLIIAGDGSLLYPYFFDDFESGVGGSLLNEREMGEYVEYGGIVWRVVEAMEDGTTKVISEVSLGNSFDGPNFYSESNKITYNPKERSSVAYHINNGVNEYIDTSKFVAHEIEVPIYKNKIIYGEEVDIKKYKVKLSAPNMYEMFSAQSRASSNYEKTHSYWLSNTSKTDRIGSAITDIGVPVNEEFGDYDAYGVRLVAYFKKGTVITKGYGTRSDPYTVN